VLRLTDLDVADIEDILEHISAWDALSQARKLEYREAFYNALYNREANPFYELMLVDAARKWRGEFMSTLTITSFVMPDEINKVFEQLKFWTVKDQELLMEKKALSNERSEAEARISTDPEFKWGKNETEREAQFRVAFPDIAKRIDANVLAIQDASNQRAMFRLELERIQTLIDLFKTTSLEV
jgi:hypothetical protein